MSAIEKSTLESEAERLKAKIRDEFVALIPPEEWSKMIQKELDRFFSMHYATSGRTEFSSICHQVFSEAVKAELQTVLKEDKPWGVSGPQISTLVKEWLTENSDQVTKIFVAQLLCRAAQTVLLNLQQNRY
jgi:hypothetical protein